MLTLKPETASLINDELEAVPEKYHKPFNSMHEALGIIREEYLELEQEIFFGEKKVKKECDFIDPNGDNQNEIIKSIHRKKVKQEAVQVAAMCARLIQEL